MKTKFTIMLTAFLMLFCVGAHAQSSLKGDVNGDGVVNETDIEEVVKIITGNSQLENPKEVGDVTGDGFVNVADIVSIVNIMKTPVGNPVITFSVKFVNNTGSEVTLDGDMRFVLGNPDHKGYELGWPGIYNMTDRITFSKESVTIPAGESKQFDGLTWKDEESGYGMGDKSPATDEQVRAADRQRNVLVYVNDNSEIVMCDNMATTIIFKEGGVYNVVLSSINSEPGPGPVNPGAGNPVVNIGVNITNNTSSPVTLDGRLRFVLGNPDHNGNYYGGYTGPYIRTDNIWFSGSEGNPNPITLNPGETRTYYNLSWRDADTGLGLGETSPLNPNQLPILDDQGGIAYARNILIYTDGRSDVTLCENLSANTVFKEGGVYDISITSASGSYTPEPGPGPVNPGAGNPVINIGVNITNNTDAPVTLDGRMRFVLGNPDHNGTYFGGYTGPYIRTDNIWFSGSEGNPNPITLNPGETRTYYNLSWRDADTGLGLGETSPLNPNQLPILDDQGGIAYARNILIYTDGRSDVTLCENLRAGTVFQDGGVYDISITSAAGGSTPQPGPGPVNPDPVVPVNPDAGNPVVNIGVNITNNTGSTITLDGRMRFVLGNPDHNGNYFGGYMGTYIRTDNIWFSSSPVTMAPGETRTYYNLSWQDADTGLGLGETSPLSPSYLPIRDENGGIAYAGNVLMYTEGRSDLLLCDYLSANTVFQEGGVYDISISSISGGSAPAPSNPGANPVINIGVNITNNTGSAITLDGRLRFVLGNPDHNGTYYGGYMGTYIRTDNIWFSNGSVVLNPGETRTYYGLSWRDADTGCGLGETSPLDGSYFPILDDTGGIAYPGNVLLYTSGRSDVLRCNYMSSGTVFQEGGVYDIVVSRIVW